MKELIEIQSKLKAPKNQYNKFGNYAYRNCEDILEAVKPLLKDQNVILTITDEVIDVCNRVYIKATATIKGKDFEHSVSALAREPENQKGMSESQITGSASSYARKYALNGLFCIDDNKDADTQDNTDKPQKKAKETDNRKWLNMDTKEWTNAVEHIEGGGALEDVYSVYKISKDNRDALQSIFDLSQSLNK